MIVNIHFVYLSIGNLPFLSGSTEHLQFLIANGLKEKKEIFYLWFSCCICM